MGTSVQVGVIGITVEYPTEYVIERGVFRLARNIAVAIATALNKHTIFIRKNNTTFFGLTKFSICDFNYYFFIVPSLADGINVNTNPSTRNNHCEYRFYLQSDTVIQGY